MLGTLVLVYVQYVVMLIELQKVLSQEIKCLCTKTTTVLSESTVPKTVDVCYISIELERKILYRSVFIYRAFHNVIHDYNHLQQENQRAYLNGIVHSHRKTENFFFWTTRDVRCVHRGWHGTHWYNIQVLAMHTSTWVHQYSSLLHRHPVSVNCLYHAWMILSVGGSFAYFAQNACCTITTDLLVWYSNTQNDFCPWAAVFSLHTLALPSGRNMNHDKNKLLGKKFLSCSFYLYRFSKYVSYGFL